MLPASSMPLSYAARLLNRVSVGPKPVIWTVLAVVRHQRVCGNRIKPPLDCRVILSGERGYPLQMWQTDRLAVGGTEHDMPFLDATALRVIERLPSWKGRFFHTATMTFADYQFTAGSTIHEHFHPEEEVYEVIAGELEMTVDGITDIARPGIVAIVPSNARHSVRALTDGRVIIVDHPARGEFG